MRARDQLLKIMAVLARVSTLHEQLPSDIVDPAYAMLYVNLQLVYSLHKFGQVFFGVYCIANNACRSHMLGILLGSHIYS